MSNIDHDAIDNEPVDQQQLETEDTSVVADDTSPEHQPEEHHASLDDAVKMAFERHSKPADTPEPAKKSPAGPVPTEPVAQAAPTKSVDPITGREVEPIKAPVGWTPVLREKWSSIDPVVQKFIHDREHEMQRTLSTTADERKVAAQFRDIASPYEAELRSYGVDALKLTKDLFTQWHTLSKGSPQQKAVLLDQMIRFFKPDIQTLVQLSQGNPPQPTAAPQPPDIDKLVEQKLSAREQARQEAEALSEVEKFKADPTNEFVSDVGPLMGKIIDAGLVQAPTMPELLKKAYDLACSQHPEVSQVLASRKVAAPPVVQSQPAAKPVRQVKPSLGAGAKSKSAPKNMSLDDAVRRAFDMHMPQ